MTGADAPKKTLTAKVDLRKAGYVEHKEPYAQRRVMRSAGLPGLVVAGSAGADCRHASASACEVRRSWLVTSGGAQSCARSPSSTIASSSLRVMLSIGSTAISSALMVANLIDSSSGLLR